MFHDNVVRGGSGKVETFAVYDLQLLDMEITCVMM